MFVTAQDFKKTPYAIPNLDDAEILADFNSFIEKTEKDHLSKVLGPLLYNEFTVGLLADPILVQWVRLRDGYAYEYMGTGYSWVGMKEICKPLVYSEWIRHRVQTFGGDAMMVPEFENAVRIDPSYEIARSWNEFVDLVGYKGYGNKIYGDNLYSFVSINEGYSTYRYYKDLRKINTFNI